MDVLPLSRWAKTLLEAGKILAALYVVYRLFYIWLKSCGDVDTRSIRLNPPRGPPKEDFEWYEELSDDSTIYDDEEDDHEFDGKTKEKADTNPQFGANDDTEPPAVRQEEVASENNTRSGGTSSAPSIILQFSNFCMRICRDISLVSNVCLQFHWGKLRWVSTEAGEIQVKLIIDVMELRNLSGLDIMLSKFDWLPMDVKKTQVLDMMAQIDLKVHEKLLTLFENNASAMQTSYRVKVDDSTKKVMVMYELKRPAPPGASGH